MTVDNQIYEREADSWWSEDDHLCLLRAMVPARQKYLRRAFVDELGCALEGAAVLDIGCGGGLFAEALAGLGCQVTGVDPSRRSIEAARQHAAQQGLSVAYQVGRGEALPLQDERFDIACCCDVLEHVEDVDAVLAESARVLKTGGLFLYDTINRTWMSRFFMIGIFQQWRWTRIVPPGLHDWQRFIKPAELGAALIRQGLRPRHDIGLAPDMGPTASLARLAALRRLKRGEISYGEFGRTLHFQPSPLRSLNYMGWASKLSG